MNTGVKKQQKSNTTENNRIFGSLEIDGKPKLQKGWEVILKNFIAVKVVKFLWWIWEVIPYLKARVLATLKGKQNLYVN